MEKKELYWRLVRMVQEHPKTDANMTSGHWSLSLDKPLPFMFARRRYYLLSFVADNWDITIEVEWNGARHAIIIGEETSMADLKRIENTLKEI